MILDKLDDPHYRELMLKILVAISNIFLVIGVVFIILILLHLFP